MSAKHTPGPWEVVALNGFGPFAIRMPTPLGTKQPTHYGVGQVGTQENACLIAAAPEMLEALKAIDTARNTDEDADWERATRLSDAAIAKADGR